MNNNIFQKTGNGYRTGEIPSCDECGALIVNKPSVITKDGRRLCGICSCKRVEEEVV